MKIELHHFYQNSQGFKLNAGVHDVDATRARYLVDNGHATLLEDAPTNEPAETVPQETATESDTSTLQALRDEYENVAGKRWYHGWDEETLQAKIDELVSE